MRDKKVRFAMVGLGNIAQTAMIPAFQNAREKCDIVALISSDREKLEELGSKYGIKFRGGYDDLEQVLKSADVDAAYIAVPNALHRELTERCAQARAHVLCEKPMAMSSGDCEAMIRACGVNGVKLMLAYRLHFDPATLQAIELARSGRLGDLCHFTASFAHDVRQGDIRTKPELGGGALYDMGIYCVNAARNVFGEEPEEVVALQTAANDRRAEGVDQTTAAILRFPGGRLATLVSAQDSADSDFFQIVGSKAVLRVEPAFTYSGELAHHLTVGEKKTTKKFPASDQFSPELLHFADCILKDEEPEPSGEEGLADVRVLEAIVESARRGRPIALGPFTRTQRPDRALEERRPPVRKPKPVNAPSPSR